jgi:3-methyladenine DNA glycosylase/8-oxoguanine DNA glycosylase
MADKQPGIRKEVLKQTQLAHEDAQRQLDQLLQMQADGGAVPAAKVNRARRLVISTEEAYEAAAEAVAKDELDVQAADAVVSSFLQLFQEIQQEFQAAGNVPCHPIMKNPYSIAERALWNRLFAGKICRCSFLQATSWQYPGMG